jgi:hypothetical protein
MTRTSDTTTPPGPTHTATRVTGVTEPDRNSPAGGAVEQAVGVRTAPGRTPFVATSDHSPRGACWTSTSRPERRQVPPPGGVPRSQQQDGQRTAAQHMASMGSRAATRWDRPGPGHPEAGKRDTDQQRSR